jgi:multidrug efflux pump subunit AcrB
MNPVRWMAKNNVASNLVMMILLLGGLFAIFSMKVEVFPEIDLDRVLVSVPYPGAGPGEVEEGIVQPIEEAINGVDGIKRIQGIASEGSGVVVAEIMDGSDKTAVTQDIKSAVDRILTFPKEAERPIVRLLLNQSDVLTVMIYGDLDRRTLRQLAERVRDDLLANDKITQAEVGGVPPYEISIDISEESLRRNNLTLSRVAATIRAASLDLPAGVVKAKGGEILLRTKEKRYTGREFESITILSRADGTTVRLGDIATVRDTFAETDEQSWFDGRPAVMVRVYRVGDQRPTEISDITRAYMKKVKSDLPASVNLGVWADRSEILESRMDLLLNNAGMGLILVVIVLGLFLEVRMAFWVTMGIPISIMGAMLLVSGTSVSINMISLFAFILVLGIVVDDAIVVGENAYAHRQMGKTAAEAAIIGAMEVGRPVTFSILTTIAAFSPLLFVSGIMGKFMRAIPVIVICVLLVSLFESIFILPAHLRHDPPKKMGPPGLWQRFQGRVAEGLGWVIRKPYGKTLELAIKFRYTIVAMAVVSLMLAVGLMISGKVKSTFMPELEGDVVRAQLVMPYGTPAKETRLHLDRLQDHARALVAEVDKTMPEGESVLRNVYAIVGRRMGSSGPVSRGGSSGAHLGEVAVWLQDSGKRDIESSEFAKRWRKLIGEIPGAESLEFKATIMHVGDPIAIQLSHDNFETLQLAAERMKVALQQYPGLHDIADSHEAGKRELQFKLRPEARTLGLTPRDLANQVRGAFYGAEALRMQRGRSELKVMVRYPTKERQTLTSVDKMRIRTPGGGEVPFSQAAEIADGRGYSRIVRDRRKRVITVSSKADEKIANPTEIMADLKKKTIPQLKADYPGLTFDTEGELKERKETMRGLGLGFLAALGIIYVLLAIPFRSYSQPLLIMSAIPFGAIGAVLGHIFLGYSLSLMSMFGLVALTGVVVNDSLVLIDFINRVRERGIPITDAVIEAGKRRFRPIILTTLTTFFALLPMLAETSVQARFLVPMAISLAFGVVFATLITLVLIPVLYVVLEDIRALVDRWWNGKSAIQAKGAKPLVATGE